MRHLIVRPCQLVCVLPHYGKLPCLQLQLSFTIPEAVIYLTQTLTHLRTICTFVNEYIKSQNRPAWGRRD